MSAGKSKRGGWPSRSLVHKAVCSVLAISRFSRFLQCKMHAKSTQSVLKIMSLIGD
jgi:hypothetical protein